MPVALLLILAALLLSATAFAAVEQSGTLRVSVSTRISPYRLPRKGTAPITAHVAGHVSSTTGAVPPQLTSFVILVNRHARIGSAGLPSCTLSQLQPGTNERALKECGSSLVGSGHFWASVVFSENRPYNTTGRLMIFAGMGCGAEPRTRQVPVGSTSPSSSLLAGPGWPGGEETKNPGPSPLRVALTKQVKDAGRRTRGAHFDVRDPQAPDRGRRDAKCQSRPEIFAHIYTTQPFPTSFVVTFAMHRISRGPWGTELTASLPSALGDWGFVDRIKLNIGRTFHLPGGAERGYIEAGCPAPAGTDTVPFPLAHAELAFANGEELSTTITRPCGVSKE